MWIAPPTGSQTPRGERGASGSGARALAGPRSATCNSTTRSRGPSPRGWTRGRPSGSAPPAERTT
eukprot:2843120-Lingulodinium_polyedra.AAC.1